MLSSDVHYNILGLLHIQVKIVLAPRGQADHLTPVKRRVLSTYPWGGPVKPDGAGGVAAEANSLWSPRCGDPAGLLLCFRFLDFCFEKQIKLN